MQCKLSKLSTLFLRLMWFIFLVICGLALVLGASQGEPYMRALVLGLVGIVFLRFLLPLVVKGLERLGYGKCLLLLAILCFVVKLFWVIKVRVPISGDYAVFWGYANSLAKSEVIEGGRYMALFPHVFGYSSFLSIFIKLFGANALLAPVLNVVLTVCSGCILFRLCWRWLHLRAAISAFLFWIVCPSQTIYNSMVLSEPLYTTLMLAFLLLVTEVSYRGEKVNKPVLVGIIAGVAGGILLRFVQGTRPIAMIWIIAMVIWLIFLNLHSVTKRGFLQCWGPFMAVLLLIYTGSGSLWDSSFVKRVGEPPASIPGYSVMVGFNKDSYGRWNREDSERLYSYSDAPGATAQWAQEQMLDDAIERVKSDDIDYHLLLMQKLRVFLGSDHTCIGYSASVLRHTDDFSLACNVFFYMSELLALWGAVRLWKRKERSTYALVPLFVLGLIVAQMLVEVAGRYHYSIVPMLILLGQAAMFDDEDRKECLSAH